MTVQFLQLQSLRSNFLLPIVYQLTLDAALKYHGKSDSSLKLEDPVTKTAFLSKSEEAYCIQTEHVIRSIHRGLLRFSPLVLGIGKKKKKS
jgi:hypothetical protein